MVLDGKGWVAWSVMMGDAPSFFRRRAFLLVPQHFRYSYRKCSHRIASSGYATVTDRWEFSITGKK